MDRALDEVIAEREQRRPRGNGRGPRDRRNNYPRDGVRKFTRDESRDLDRDWVHDKYEDDDTRRPTRRSRPERELFPRDDEPADAGARLRVDNLHYDLTEDDIRELFSRISHVQSVQLLYDRQDRSKGTAFVTYSRIGDARRAIREFDGANAYGQPIHLTLVQSRPSRNPFDSAVPPSRSLFDRIERDRSASPRGDRDRIRHSDVSRPAPEHIDRYVPDDRSTSRRRSPAPRRAGGRDSGRRPGQRREGGRRNASKDGDGRPLAQGRPRKTQEELDAEMEDYWRSNAGAGNDAAAAAAQPAQPAQIATEHSGMVNGQGETNGAHANFNAGTTAPAIADDDIDMIE